MADLEHITAEGETYDISDATARTDISALQTENAELKAQIAEMEEEISELNSDLASVGIAQSDYFSDAGSVQDFAAYKSGNWIYAIMRIACTSGSNQYARVNSKYCPAMNAYGFLAVVSNSDDSSSFNNAAMYTSGQVWIWASQAFLNSEWISFIYPVA